MGGESCLWLASVSWDFKGLFVMKSLASLYNLVGFESFYSVWVDFLSFEILYTLWLEIETAGFALASGIGLVTVPTALTSFFVSLIVGSWWFEMTTDWLSDYFSRQASCPFFGSNSDRLPVGIIFSGSDLEMVFSSLLTSDMETYEVGWAEP